MEYEIELKLLTNEQAGEIIEKKLLPQLNASVNKNTLVLTNHYFDTPDRTLRRNDIGLRIRGNNQQFEQTLKTAGKSIGGLHQRPEYNVQLDDSFKQSHKIPNLALFPVSAWPETIDVDELQTKIETLFTTHFERHIYLLEFSSGDIVELVWDLGEVTSGSKSVPICEIELELKKGNIAAIFSLAKCIVSLLPTIIGTDSKAARGYNLRDCLPAKELKQFEVTSPDNTPTQLEDFISLLTIKLQNFQALSTEIRQQYSDSLAPVMTQGIASLVGHVERFNDHFPCPFLDDIHKALMKLNRDWTIVMQENDQNAVHTLLSRSETTTLQLDIVQCLVERPWSAGKQVVTLNNICK